MEKYVSEIIIYTISIQYVMDKYVSEIDRCTRALCRYTIHSLQCVLGVWCTKQHIRALRRTHFGLRSLRYQGDVIDATLEATCRLAGSASGASSGSTKTGSTTGGSTATTTTGTSSGTTTGSSTGRTTTGTETARVAEAATRPPPLRTCTLTHSLSLSHTHT